MLTDDLKQLGQQIVTELKIDHNSITQKWMAHYIAELITKTEDSNEEDKVEDEKYCSQLILQLWDSMNQRKQSEIKYKFGKALDAGYEKRHNVSEIQNILHNPDTIDALTGEEKLIILFVLDDIEQDLIRLRIFGNVLAEETTESLPETVENIKDYMGIYQVTILHLKDIWPEVEFESYTQRKNIDTFVAEQLRFFLQLRTRILKN